MKYAQVLFSSSSCPFPCLVRQPCIGSCQFNVPASMQHGVFSAKVIFVLKPFGRKEDAVMLWGLAPCQQPVSSLGLEALGL